MTQYKTLAEAIAAPRVDDPPWADADRYTSNQIGRDLADLITWDIQTDDHQYGTLAGPDQTRSVHYTCHEPSTELLEVRVPCRHDPGCSSAWDIIEDRADLGRAIEGTLYNDPACDVHQERT